MKLLTNIYSVYSYTVSYTVKVMYLFKVELHQKMKTAMNYPQIIQQA